MNDLAVGSNKDDDGGTDRGAVWVLFLNGNGTVKSHQKISDTEGEFTGSLDDDDRFGKDVSSVGDLDGDGVTDLSVGAFFDDDGGTDRGAVWVLFLNGNGTVKSHQKISDTEGEFTGSLDDNDHIGYALTSLDDLDGDGVADLAVGSFYDDDGGTDRGAVWVLFMTELAVEVSISDLVAGYNQTIKVPMRVDNATDQEVVSVELFVSFSSGYSGGLLPVFSSAVSAMGIISGWSLESNVVFSDAPTPGRIDTLKMAMATDDEPIGNTGGIRDLLMLSFQVADIRHPATALLTLEHVLFNDGVPSYIATNGSIKLVGTDGTIDSDPVTIIPRWPIQITITDIDEDRDTGSADAFDVRVTNGSQTEAITVTETGNSTGVFDGSIITVFSLGATSGDDVVQARAGDAISFCYDDSLNADGETEERCATTNVIGGTNGQIRTTVVSQPGDTVRVRVEDADLSESVAVTVENPRTGEAESILLSIFTPGTSVFYGRIFTDRGAAAGTPGNDVLNVLKADVLLITYADELTALGGTATVPDDNEVVDPFGDVDDNGQVQAYDAALVLAHRLSTYGGGDGTLSGLDSLSANVDQAAPFGIIDGYDASLILRKVVSLIDRFEVQEPDAVNHPQPETNLLPKPVLEERRLALVPGEGYVSVWCADRGKIVSGELTLAGVQGQVAMGAELQAFLTASQATDGGMQVVFAGAEAVSGAGELMRIAGVGSGDARLTRVSFNGGRIDARWEEGSTSITLPVSFALHPNHPNPFNPETTIRYDLPIAGSVSLRIYDVTGQVVRELTDAFQPAGSYSIVWNGRNERGDQVANSVYLYELRAGDYRAIRKMLLMK